jgi:hypothetical protein
VHEVTHFFELATEFFQHLTFLVFDHFCGKVADFSNVVC